MCQSAHTYIVVIGPNGQAGLLALPAVVINQEYAIGRGTVREHTNSNVWDQMVKSCNALLVNHAQERLVGS